MSDLKDKAKQALADVNQAILADEARTKGYLKAHFAWVIGALCFFA